MGDWQANLEDYLFHVAHHTHTKDLAVDLVLDLFRHLFFLAAIEALVVRITSIHTHGNLGYILLLPIFFGLVELSFTRDHRVRLPEFGPQKSGQ